MAGCLLFYLFIFEYTADHTIISRLHMQKYKLLKPLWCLNVTCGETHVTLIWLFLCCKYFLFFSYFHEKNGLNLCWGSVHEGSYIFLDKVIHYSCISYYLPIFLSISVSTSLPWTLSHTHTCRCIYIYLYIHTQIKWHTQSFVLVTQDYLLLHILYHTPVPGAGIYILIIFLQNDKTR